MELFYGAVSDLRRDYDLSILLVSHDIELVAPFADRMVLIDGGAVASGTPSEVMAGEAFRKRFGTNLRPGGRI
jgi:zinc transport system ATP-binding protein